MDRIRLVQRLRSPEFGSMPIARVHRVLDRVDKGVSVEVAVRMERLTGLPADRDDDRVSLEALGERFDVPVDALKSMVRMGLLVPDPFGRVRGFTSLEGTLARALHEVVEETPLTLDDLRPIVRLVADLSRLEMGLRDRVVEGKTRGEENALATLKLQRVADLLHPYLLSRTLEREIADRRAKASLAVERSS